MEIGFRDDILYDRAMPVFADAEQTEFEEDHLQFSVNTKWVEWLGLLAVPFLIAGCSTAGKVSGRAPAAMKNERGYSYSARERACLERAMFFEANRSSREGLIAVGTVVMNRVHSSGYPDTICGVVGQKNQFAPGVLTRTMNRKIVPDVRAAADAVLRGERHRRLGKALFFHTAGLKFPYRNMHYVLVAGGNAFYEKRRRDGSLSVPVNDSSYDMAYAFSQEKTDMNAAAVFSYGAVTNELQPVTDGKDGIFSGPAREIPVPRMKTVTYTTRSPGDDMYRARKVDHIGVLLLEQQKGRT